MPCGLQCLCTQLASLGCLKQCAWIQHQGLSCMHRQVQQRHMECAGAEATEDWKQWAAQQADMQSLDSFCFSTQDDRPASAQSPYSPGRRTHVSARPASAAAPATRPRTQQLWRELTRFQPAKPPVQAENSGRTSTARADSPAGKSENSPERSKRCASPKQAEGAAAHDDKPTQHSSAAIRYASGEGHSPQAQADSKLGSPQPSAIAEAAAEAAEATVTRTRPVTAQLQVQAPGVFLRKARPQSAGAANVTQAKAKAAHLGVQAFNEPKRETGWVDFRAQNRVGSRVSQLLSLLFGRCKSGCCRRLLTTLFACSSSYSM